MHKHAAGLALFFLAAHASADDFANCLLASSRQGTVSSALASCRSEHPTGYANVLKGSGDRTRYRNAQECVAANAPANAEADRRTLAGQTCQCLYDRSESADENCDSDFEKRGIHPLQGARPGQQK